MKYIKDGIIWILAVLAIFIVLYFVPYVEGDKQDMGIVVIMFFVVFEAIGVFLLAEGVKQFIAEKINEITYGQIISICETETAIDDKPQFQVEILTYVPSGNWIMKIKKIVEFQPVKYEVDDYVQLRYYQGDVDIIQKVTEDMVPRKDLSLLKERNKKEKNKQ